MTDGSPSPRDVSAGASNTAVRTLVLNLILPGLGTIIGGNSAVGAIQIALFLVGIPLIFLFGLGLLVMAGVYIWGIIVGVKAMSASTGQPVSSGQPASKGPDFH